MSPPKTPSPIAEPSDAADAAIPLDKTMPPLPVPVSAIAEPKAPEPTDVQAKTPDDAKALSFNILRKKSKGFSSAVSPQAQSFAEQVRGAAMVTADIRTNVIVGREYHMLAEVSKFLALRYNRPLASVAVTLHHSACMLFQNSVDPAYMLTVVAIPPLIQPTLNRRTTILAQKLMEDVLGVPGSRGLVRFVAAAEDAYGIAGNTYAGKMDDLLDEMGRQRELQTTKKSLSLRRPGSTVSRVPDGPNNSSQQGIRELEVPPKDSGAKEEADGWHVSPGKPEERVLNRKKSFLQTIFQRNSKSKGNLGMKDNYE